MTEEEIARALSESAAIGFVIKHDDDKYSLSPAGRDYVESVLLPGVEQTDHIYSLGRLQGLRERSAALSHLSGVLRGWAAAIRADGTPSQVGPTADECDRLAKAIDDLT